MPNHCKRRCQLVGNIRQPARFRVGRDLRADDDDVEALALGQHLFLRPPRHTAQASMISVAHVGAGRGDPEQLLLLKLILSLLLFHCNCYCNYYYYYYGDPEQLAAAEPAGKDASREPRASQLRDAGEARRAGQQRMHACPCSSSPTRACVRSLPLFALSTEYRDDDLSRHGALHGHLSGRLFLRCA